MKIANAEKPRAIEIDVFGINTPHEPGFTIDRPKCGTWLLMCFRTPFTILTAHGIEQGAPGDLILHDPTFPERHGPVAGDSCGFSNDWLHLRGDGVGIAARRYGVPINTRIAGGDPFLLTPALHELRDEQLRRARYWDEAAGQLVLLLILRIGRLCAHADEGAARPSSSAVRARFAAARLHVLGSPGRPWTVAEMAAAVGLGPNRFAVLYKGFFGVSPGSDLMLARLSLAKARLLSSDATLDEIADECGFFDGPYLSRIFRDRVGCTPGRYRQIGILGDD